jgi:uncharacterized repeat protein (TIGR01451 family)
MVPSNANHSVREGTVRTFKVLFPIVFGLFITFALIGGFASASHPTSEPNSPTNSIIYVDADAPGPTHDGTSWTEAYATVQDALTAAISGTQIWVAEGVYYPDEGIGQINDSVTSTFVLTDGVALYGGFDPGSGVEEFTERDWETYITVLSGDLEQNDITDTHGVVLTTTNIVDSNAYHVVYSKGVTDTALLDGFYITAGQAKGDWPYNIGGGMYNYSSDPTLTNVTFSGNSAGLYGGGMYNTFGSNPTLTNVTFSGNTATWGGGMRNYNSSPTLTTVTFSGNKAGGKGGGMSNDENSSPELTNVTFSGNEAAIYGGGMYNYSSDPTLTNVTFSGNTATWGGGMYNNGSSPELKTVTFSGNQAGGGGGMRNYWYSNPTIHNSILWNNQDDGGTDASAQIYNAGSTPVISYTLVQGSNGSGGSWDASLGTDGGGNIDADPLFVRDPDDGGDGWGDDPGTSGTDEGANDDFGDLHLQAGSPAVDAGTNTGCPETDLDGNPRPINAVCDMGAYEFVPLHLKKSVDVPFPQTGQTITFTIQVTNHMTETATGGVVSDALPAGLNIAGPINLEPPLSGTVGSTPPLLVTGLTIGASEKVTITIPVSISFGLARGTVITNTAWITSNEVMTPFYGSATITVANSPPDAVDDPAVGSEASYTTDEDTPITTTSVLINDTDLDGDILSVVSFDAASTKGLVTNKGDGTFSYDPNDQFEELAAGEQATDTFTYTISDGHGGTDTAMVTIKIIGKDEEQDEFFIYLPVVVK